MGLAAGILAIMEGDDTDRIKMRRVYQLAAQHAAKERGDGGRIVPPHVSGGGEVFSTTLNRIPMEDYMAEIDAGKPPLTGTELRMQIAEDQRAERLKQETERVREILTDLVVDANVGRALHRLMGLPRMAIGPSDMHEWAIYGEPAKEAIEKDTRDGE